MVAHGHGIKSNCIHKFDICIALVRRIHERALVLVARIQYDHIFARQIGPQLVDDSCNTRHAAKAFAFGVILNAICAIEPANRLNATVEVVDVDDVQCGVGSSCCGQKP